VTRVMGRASVVGARRVTGSRWVIISADEAVKVTNAHQFFYFVPECFAILCSVAIVEVIAAIFGHINIGGE